MRGKGDQSDGAPVKPKRRVTGVLRGDAPMPENIEAEKAVLAAMLKEPRPCLDSGIETFGGEKVFHHHAHEKIYECLCDLNSRDGGVVDFITVANELDKQGVLQEVGGDAYLAEIENFIATTANFESWCQIVKDYALVRKMIGVCHNALDKCYEVSEDVESIMDEVEGDILRVRDETITTDIVEVKALAKEAFKEIQDLYYKRVEPGIKTRFPDLDDKVTGLKPGEMFVLAARPSIGKTSFALNVVRNIGLDPDNPRPIAFFSLEMTAKQIAMRFLCTEANISIKDIYDKSIKPVELNHFTTAAQAFKNANIFVDPTPGLKVSQLRAKARRLKALNNIELIVIDYLQLMNPARPNDSRQQEVSEISHSIKALAKELNVPVLVLAQLNREIEKGTGKAKPKLSHLRESGAIEQDADVVTFLHRDRDTQRDSSTAAQAEGIPAELIIEKNRNGETGIVDLLFFPKRMLFTCASHRYTKEDLPS